MSVISDAEAVSLAVVREQRDWDVPSYALPQLNDSAAEGIFERIAGAERDIAAPRLCVEDYAVGSALVPDELLVLSGISPVLLTSEHATQQTRNAKPKMADYGTGGLGAVVAEDSNATYIVPRGHQTADANFDVDHPIKEIMGELIADPQNMAHFSLHAVGIARAASLTDERGFNILLGIGSTPTDYTLAAVERIKEIGANYDLRVGVNADFIVQREGVPRRNEDGSLRMINFSAAGKGTTRDYAQTRAQAVGKDNYAAIQFELARQHRLEPLERQVGKDGRALRMGVYVGYLFMLDSVRAINELAAS